MKEIQQGKSQNGLNGNQTTNAQTMKKCTTCHGNNNGENHVILMFRCYMLELSEKLMSLIFVSIIIVMHIVCAHMPNISVLFINLCH